MKISLSWLKDYIDLEGITVDEIVDKLTTSGLEVEEVIDKSKELDNFVVGYVKEKNRHPNADKLSVCIVSDGEREFNVICGASNVEAGQKIVFAKVGSIIPSGKAKLSKVKIRGEYSHGMICSEKELEIGDDREGIMILSDELEIGMPIAKALGFDDVILDIAVTPNRADALSHIGVARDLSAIYNRPLKLPVAALKESSEEASSLASIEIVNTIDCPRYVGKVVTGVTIKESPDLIQNRLKGIGLRPINNIVDITNFVLYEIGQPLHAFDLDTLAGKKIVVKSANEGEKFTTLDSKERELWHTDLMICDGEKSVAIAGVMGGENSEVSEITKNVLIESAYFLPSAVRKTAKHLGLLTDASYRFERGCNPDITIFAAERAAELIAKYGGGKIAKGVIDVYPEPNTSRQIAIRITRLEKVLGFQVPPSDVKNILNNLSLKVIGEEEGTFNIEVPSFRPDIEREIDLIEEVARIYGYDKIPIVEKISVTLEEKIDQSEYDDKVRNIFSSMGFYEIITNSLLNKETATRYGKAIKILNPQSYEMSHARPSLLPGMLSTISRNLKVKEKNLMLFEIGEIFEMNNETEIRSFDDFTESEHLLVAITGNAEEKEWNHSERNFDIFDLKGFIDEFLRNISLDKITEEFYNHSENIYCDDGFYKNINNLLIGSGGKIKKQYLIQFDISQDVYMFDINLSELKIIKPESKEFIELLKFPKVIRDFAFIFDKNTDSEAIKKTIFQSNSNLLKNIKLFDIFESESLGKNKKSLAFQLEYFDRTRTLTDEEVDKEFWNAIEVVSQKFNAKLRSS